MEASYVQELKVETSDKNIKSKQEEKSGIGKKKEKKIPGKREKNEKSVK